MIYKIKCKFVLLSQNSIALTCRLMFKVTLSLGDRGYEIEVKIAFFEMDVCISESERALCYAVT